VALSLAAARPDLVRAVMAWEPPWIPLAPPADRTRLAGVAARVEEAHRSGGRAAAARSFMEVVSPGAWERLRGSAQDALAASGDGVLADAAMPGLDTDGLSRIAAPVVIGTGAESEAAYAPIADALVRRIPGARVESLTGLRHAAPIVAPTAIAQLVRPLLGPVPAPVAQEPTP
jgi:pimeloyl-ACP methyl ester carboxylesterase